MQSRTGQGSDINQRKNSFWLHIITLSGCTRSSINEAESHNRQPYCCVNAEKRADSVRITIRHTASAYEQLVEISLKQLIKMVNDYRIQSLSARDESESFQEYVALHCAFIAGKDRQIEGCDKQGASRDQSLKQAAIQARLIATHRAAQAAPTNGPTALRQRLRILVLGLRSFPYGGGESWLMESSRWLMEKGHQVILVNFKESDWNLFPTTYAHEFHGLARIAVGMADTDEAVIQAIGELNRNLVPDIIHSQGEVNTILNENYEPMWPALCCGYHFWNGLIRLGSRGNRELLEPSHQLMVEQAFTQAVKHRRYFPYVVSPFMLEILKKAGYGGTVATITPVSRAHQSCALTSATAEVVQLNCALLKGGGILIQMALMLPSISFRGFCALWEELDELRLQAEEQGHILAIQKNKLIINERSWIEWTWIEQPAHLMAQSLCLLMPSLVDETFGRVVVEAIDSGCPVIASNVGNLVNLLPDGHCLEVTAVGAWKHRIETFTDPEKRAEVVRLQREHLALKGMDGRQEFLEFLQRDVYPHLYQKNMAILAPWSEQGLGYHARTYADALQRLGVTPHIYSYQPYSANGLGPSIQTDPNEWSGYHVHYSFNHREELTAHEIYQFCCHHSCKVLLVPEVCWSVNWNRLERLANKGLDVLIIPNPETLRQSEILNHAQYPRILCTTRLVEKILHDQGIENTAWIGHGEGEGLTDDQIKQRLARLDEYISGNTVKIVHIAGYNHRRKMTAKIVDDLAPFLRINKFIQLSIYSQVSFEREITDQCLNLENIFLNQGDFSHQQIMKAYAKASFSLQLSSHEGLGLGFYESLSQGTPVITLDHPPHNEAIEHGVTGFLVPCKHIPLYDNDDALITGGIFDRDSLYKTLLQTTPARAKEMAIQTIQTHRDQWSISALANRLQEALRGIA
jgi:glycosyltransferase involved in cell wall biosynthesis